MSNKDKVEAGSTEQRARLDRPRRKFNIAKVAGSATNVKLIEDEDRLFDHAPSLSHSPFGGDG